MRDVIAADFHPVDDRRLPLRDHPAEVHDRLPIGGRAPQHVRSDLHVDVAVVVVQRLELAGRVLPLLLVEVRDRLPLPDPEESGALLLRKRIERLELLARKAPAADDLERADPVGFAFTQAQHQRGLAARLIDDQGVAQHLEVHVPARAVELGEPLPHVGGEFLVVVLARAEPPEALGPGFHVLQDLFVAEVRVALDVDLRDRDAAPFLHVEDDAHGRGVVFVDEQRPRVGEVEPLGAIQRIDARPRVLHRRRIDRPAFRELHLVAHRAFAQPLHAADRPFHEGGPLPHANQDDVLASRRARLFHADVVVLARPVERQNRALHVLVGERSSGQQATRLEDGDRRGAPGALHGDGVGGEDRRGLALRAARARGEHGETQDKDGGKAECHAFKPESALNARRSLSGATSTSISSPRANSPTRIFSESGSSTYFWMARFKGRAP